MAELSVEFQNYSNTPINVDLSDTLKCLVDILTNLLFYIPFPNKTAKLSISILFTKSVLVIKHQPMEHII